MAPTELVELGLQTAVLPPGQLSCGVRHERGLSGICDPTDGQLRETFLNQTTVGWFGEFPWLASVRGTPATRTDSPLPLCGGALVHPIAVLTSAACYQLAAQRSYRVTVRLAEFRVTTDVDFGRPASEHRIARAVYHPDFQLTGGNEVVNDVVLLLLERPAALDGAVGLICLPDGSLSADQEAASWKRGDCVLHGWSNPRKDALDAVLHEPVHFLSTSTCQAALRRTRSLHPSFACGQSVAAECWADVGSVMACRDPRDRSRWALAGMVPWSHQHSPCGQVSRYTNIGRYSGWIKDTIAAHLSAQT
ncbi:phenoloxidase-activating factor 2-like [Pollicipes pollicipes]|uniref:phenoloxidase-activating factor 2-like n=1 Tax=Pollicipes pollicipes TaxID=41117 RepID=UPI0018858BC9|nr:phenoloxidase-activating factor 2-like [Pollicipes pollicipes]